MSNTAERIEFPTVIVTLDKAEGNRLWVKITCHDNFAAADHVYASLRSAGYTMKRENLSSSETIITDVYRNDIAGLKRRLIDVCKGSKVTLRFTVITGY